MTTYERSFDVDEPPAAAWARLGAAQPADLPAGRWWLPGFDSTGEELDVDEPSRLTVRKDAMPCEGTTISFTFEHRGSGTRITVVQSGFDDAFVEGSGESFWLIAEQIGVDAELFFTRGVKGGRHSGPFAFLGFGTTTTPVGLEVSWVLPDTYAERAGYEAGDLVLSVGGAPIVGERDLLTVSRLVTPGTEVSSVRARGGELIEITAVL